SGDQARISLSRQPIIQPVPRGSSLIDKGHLLIRKVVAYMVQQVLHFIRHAQGSDESLVSTKSCRDALFVHVQSGKHIILPGNKCLASHRSASLIQWLKFQPLYLLLSTRGEPQHPSYKSQEMLCAVRLSSRPKPLREIFRVLVAALPRQGLCYGFNSFLIFQFTSGWPPQ